MNRDRESGRRERDSFRDRDFDDGPPLQKRVRKEERIPYGDAYESNGGARESRDRGGSGRPPSPLGGGAPTDFRTLCVSNMTPRAPDTAVKEALYEEFKKFGDFNVKVVHNGDRRIAYVNFRYPEDAAAAKYARTKLMLFDMPVHVDAVFNKRPHSQSPERFVGGESRSGGGGRDHFQGGRSQTSPHGSDRGGGGSSGGGRGGFRQEGGRGEGFGGGGGGNRDMYQRNDYNSGGERGGGGHRGGGGGNKFFHGEHREHREPKFPHHLNHVAPEDDEKSTRTLFVGNLDISITDPELKRTFERFGAVEDIDVKRPARGQGNAYAFVKFYNLDVAHRAKVTMSGQYIDKFQCKIGYGKAVPSTCVWVGGVGPWVKLETLEQEFDRFGAIHRIQWPDGKDYAYVLYDSIEAAQAAVQEMRGFPLGGPDKRLRTDFADASHMSGVPNEGTPSMPPTEQPFRGRSPDPEWRGGSDGPPPERGNPEGNRDEFRGQRRENYNQYGNEAMDNGRRPAAVPEEERVRGHPRDDHVERVRRGPGHSPSGSRGRDDFNGRDSYGDHPDRARGPGGEPFDRANIIDVANVYDLAKALPVVWSGALVLKNKAFATKMHLVSGDVHLVDTLMRDPTSTETSVLKITQRLRLDQPKLDEVGRRVSTSGNQYSVLLAMQGTANLEDQSLAVQQRPVKNLVTYLKQKEAAGVISLPPTPDRNRDIGVLHAFPPCQFGVDYLTKRSPKITLESAKDDYLVIVVVKGAV